MREPSLPEAKAGLPATPLCRVDLRGSRGKIVGAIVDTIIRQNGNAPERIAVIGDVTIFVLRTLAGMPVHLRLPLLVLTHLLGTWSCLGKGGAFHLLPLAARLTLISRWEHAPRGFQRSLITFYRTFAIYGLYSELYGGDFQYGGEDG